MDVFYVAFEGRNSVPTCRSPVREKQLAAC